MSKMRVQECAEFPVPKFLGVRLEAFWLFSTALQRLWRAMDPGAVESLKHSVRPLSSVLRARIK